MRKAAVLFAVAAVFGSAGLAALTASGAVAAFEKMTEEQVAAALDGVDSDWTTITVDGLVVNLYGRAPSERDRFTVLEALSASLAGNRIKDQSLLAGEDANSVPSFSMEILRNGTSVSLIGQVPEGAGGQLAAGRLDGIDDLVITDMLEARDFNAPGGWNTSLEFALDAVRLFDHGSATVTPSHVSIAAVAATAESGDDLRKKVTAMLPSGVTLDLAVDAPMPTIAPFDFAIAANGDTGQLTRCAAPSADAAGQLGQALAPWGLDVADCRIGLGAPGPNWTAVVIDALATLHQLGGGSLVVEGPDIHLTTLPGAAEADFNAARDALTAKLPPLYTLHATLTPVPVTETVEAPPPPLLVATRGEDGNVRLRGDLPDAMLSRAAQAIAGAHFGFDAVLSETTSRSDLPNGWSARVLAGIEALALLNVGEAAITETSLRVTGEAQTAEVEPAMRMLLQSRLAGQTAIQTAITVNPREAQPVVSEQRAELCEQQIAGLLINAQIQFPPGQTEIDEASTAIIDRVAQILADCPGARFEIGGHTDAQGRESSNLAISQARAAKVLDALLARGVDKVFLVAQGYGEALPVAENDTEEGRAANRRIEFRLIREGEEDTGGLMLAGEDDPEAATEVATEAVEVAAEDTGDEGADQGAEDTGAEVEEDLTEGSAASGDVLRPRPRDLGQ